MNEWSISQDDVSRTLHLSAAVISPGGVTHRPGGLLAEGGKAVAWGERDAMQQQHGGDAAWCDHGDVVLMPGLVNAHAHLELSGIGPLPYGGDFLAWLGDIRTSLASDEGDPDLQAERFKTISAAIAASRSAGVDAIGDVTSGHAGWVPPRMHGMSIVSYLEWFGLGPPWDVIALAGMSADSDAWTGYGHQPHAPYSAGPSVYAAASAAGQRGLPVCTHLAESHDEARFVSRGDGPFRDMLEGIGKWDDAYAAHYGQGLSPVRWMEPYLRATPWLVAHGNYVDDDDLSLLAETNTSVAFCPIASAYFLHEGHRYREMLDAGINVCLGTDSVVCQPPEEAQPLGVLPQIRFLYHRDGTDPDTLFRMATMNGRRALRLDDMVRTLLAVPIDPADATKPLVQALRSDAPGRGVAL